MELKNSALWCECRNQRGPVLRQLCHHKVIERDIRAVKLLTAPRKQPDISQGIGRIGDGIDALAIYVECECVVPAIRADTIGIRT